MPDHADAFAAKRAAMREEFLARHFLLGGWIGGTDTYKRTMWAPVPDIARARAGYTLTTRPGAPEPGAGKPPVSAGGGPGRGAGNQRSMAGHGPMFASGSPRPLRRRDIERAAGCTASTPPS